MAISWDCRASRLASYLPDFRFWAWIRPGAIADECLIVIWCKINKKGEGVNIIMF